MRGNLRETFLFAAPVDCVLVGRSIGVEQSELKRLAALLGIVGLAVLAAGLLGGWWLATRAIRPVEDISATATRIAAGDLSQRIPTAATDDELGRLADVLNTTFARLEAAFAQQTQFTADAAHELRTPVSVMLTQVQSALTRERSGAEYRETLEACERAAQRMRRLIESLLELARLDAGQEPLRSEACALATIATESVEFLRPVANSRHLEFRLHLETANCPGDAERLGQVVTNLLNNAIEYNDEGGTVEVATQARNGRAVLVVRNTGPGIPAEDLPHVFERFRRADKSRTASAHAGLGLAICEAIVQGHGGSIEVTSTAENGTTFTVTLPV
jgi:heavy metal sensor kinase